MIGIDESAHRLSAARRGAFHSRAIGAFVSICFLFAMSLAGASPAAAAPEFFTRFGESGSGAGQLSFGRGIAADPVSGDVYVADEGNNRIDEYTAWGQFVRAWGWGVADGAREAQECTSASGCLMGLPGGGAGQLNGPNGVAIDSSGNVYVFERQNERVQKFDSSGHFILAFGGDVVAQGPDNSTNDETQEITVAASSGSFKLVFADPFGSGEVSQTPALAYNASAATVQSALDALPTIADHGGSVTVSGGPGDATGSAPYFVKFEGGLAGDDVPQLTIERGNLGPAAIGARLVCSTATEAATVKYAWLRNGVPIAGANSSTYVTTAADEGKSIQCQVFAIDAEAGTTQVANPTYVAPPAPVVAPPVAPSEIERPGGASVSAGQTTMQCNPNNGSGSWQGAVSFSFSWYRNGVQITGANAEIFEVTAAEVEAPAYFQCAVTASNSGGATTKVSRPTPTIPQPSGRLRQSEGASASMEPVVTTNQGGGREVCAVADGDVCQKGDQGVMAGQFGVEEDGGTGSRGSYIAVGPDGTVYVADRNRIEEFESDGAYKTQIPLPAEGNPGALAVDPTSGDLYFAFADSPESLAHALKPNVYRLSPVNGEVLKILQVALPSALATDSDGDVYVYDGRPYLGGGVSVDRILEFDANGSQIAVLNQEGGPGATEWSPGLAVNTVTQAGEHELYVVGNTHGLINEDFIASFGPPPGKWPPPVVQPQITSEFATAVATEDALLKTEINPKFWDDATYYVEYGTSPCSEGGCADAPTAGANLTSKVISEPVAASVFVNGLRPSTAYYYRFVTQSGGGGPVIGEEHMFTTYGPPKPNDETCPNQALRTGASAFLPDCRAYEMVSPVDKNNGDVLSIVQTTGFPTALDQSALDGSGLTYTSYRSFGESNAAPYASQYLAKRGPDGWSSTALGPRRDGKSFFGTGLSLDNEFRVFSADLSRAWLLRETEPTLEGCAPQGFADVYRDDIGTGSYRALNCEVPQNRQSNEFYPEIQGVSSDGNEAIFRVNEKLTPNASSTGNYQLYESAGEGELRLVSAMPDGKASSEYASAGTANDVQPINRFQGVTHALSADGSRVFWSTATADVGPGKIYLRENADKPPTASGACSASEPTDACTVPVSESVSTAPARFETASADGAKAIYKFEAGSHKGDLYEYNVAKKKSTLIAHKVVDSLLGSSEDASRLYFASEEALTGANDQHKAPIAGKPNLYLYDAKKKRGERYRFVGTLAAYDVAREESALGWVPFYHVARVSPDGEAALFSSVASLTGYDNSDASSGVADREVYLYQASADEGQGKLVCVSCNPTGERPSGELQEYNRSADLQWVAARIPASQTELYSSHLLSDDGQRAFFDSYDSLTLRDGNGKQDVYEWEAPGSGGCSTQAPSYSPPNEGCLSLISTGESPEDSELLDASATGSDVFFTTSASLVPQDSGLIDVYDARVDGGFPAAPGQPASCEGEACQGQPSPPNDQTPASAIFDGPGDLASPLTTAVKPKTKSAARLRAAALAKALKACRKKAKPRRKRCERAAHRRYPAKSTSSARKGARGGK